ncbi:ERCC4 domain-containing protein [Nakamurella aerolata]|uniref:ERCC4 domain-containing protein n=1 Tax=Nakamurella aerolata TaxID=1656892 RepID=UPI001BB1B807
MASELVIARNPDPESTLPYLLWVPVDGGRVFRSKETWPRTKAVFCYPLERGDWPAEPDVLERVTLRSCVRRGAAIDLVADRGREARSQIVFTRARGRPMVFWQAPRTRKQARPDVRIPTARAAGLADLRITVDSRERYAYKFTGQQVSTQVAALPVGDYGLLLDGVLSAAVERKSVADLASSVLNGTLRFALGELAALPRGAVVIEDRYSAVFKLPFVKAGVLTEALAELQVRYPNVPMVFCETRTLAEEWTFRFLGACRVLLEQQAMLDADVPSGADASAGAAVDPPVATPSATAAAAATVPTATVRAWAQREGLDVAPTGRVSGEVRRAYLAAHPAGG